MPRTTPGAQKSLQNCWQRKEAVERCDLALAKWMIDTCVPFNAVNSVYYQHVIDVVTVMSSSYKRPNLHAIRGYYLVKTIDEVKIYVESYREIWKKTGCTLMTDGRTDQKRRTLINFLVCCPKGTIFLKTVDVSDVSKTARLLYQLFREVVLYIGVENIVHMVNDNAANYIAAGSILAHKDELRAMVTFREWVSSDYAKDSKEKKFVEIRVLRMVDGDGDDRPSMGYLYDVIHHAKEEMMRRFQKRKARVKPFIDIINNRWDGQLYRNLYAAAFWLNSRFQYDANIMDKHMSTISGLLDVFEKYAHGNLPLQNKITSEIKLFRNAEHDFGRASAINNRTLMPPDDCDDEVSKEHADDLLGVDESGSIPSTFDPNFASMETEELNVFIQQK
ncbi:uncharacterized protein LOC112325050 [Populus trichocarpa]|uniref:uncharacterized protein LOC112325050 n=1 Tax=Populus trichocarpa TaxID=3694 RepID=UPI002279038C|nr:uncharacterized protein LOC112325050 [Populus trichocarpa]